MHKRWLHQALCCLILALVVVPIAEQKEWFSFLGKLAYPVYAYLFPVLRRVYRDSGFEQNYLVFGMSFVLAAIIFLVVRVTTYVRPARSLLLILPGLVSVAAYPLGSLWSQWHWLRMSNAQALWLLLEIIIVVVCTMFYLHRRWPIPGRLTLVLLAVHFGFWLWVSESFGRAVDIARAYGFSQLGAWFTIFNVLLLAILGCISSYAWAAYLTFQNTLPAPAD